MTVKAYTLADLAHLSRCLFPGDFKAELIEMGLSEEDAGDLACMLRPDGKEGRTRNILELYQECLACTQPADAIAVENYCQWWLNKYSNSKGVQHGLTAADPQTEVPDHQ